MFTKQTKFILAIALQVVIIFAIIIFKLSVLSGGTEVFLRIEPVDPRDYLRGDYIDFRYNISVLDSYYAQENQIRNGDTVYVVLRETNKNSYAESVQKSRPIGNKLFIKGKVESGGSETDFDSSSRKYNANLPKLHIIYGIEQYFIPEGTGRNFNFPRKELAAQVVIDDNGNALLKQIYIDDKPWP